MSGFWIKPCPSCGGTGGANGECETCGGTGTNPENRSQ